MTSKEKKKKADMKMTLITGKTVPKFQKKENILKTSQSEAQKWCFGRNGWEEGEKTGGERGRVR